jgi:hypothetical protein
MPVAVPRPPVRRCCRRLLPSSKDSSLLFLLEAILVMEQELRELKDQAVYACDFCVENRICIVTADQEVKWLERSGLTANQYLRELEAAPDVGVILVPSPG